MVPFETSTQPERGVSHGRPYAPSVEGELRNLSAQRLLDQPNRQRIAIEFSFTRFYRRDDHQDDVDQIQHAKEWKEKETDQDEHKDKADNPEEDGVDQHRDLKVKRFLALIIYLRCVVALQQPDDQGPNNVPHRRNDQAGESAGVAKHRPHPNIICRQDGRDGLIHRE